MSKRAVLYLRVSTDEQRATGYSLSGQLDSCRKYAEQNGFTIVGNEYWKVKEVAGEKKLTRTPPCEGATLAYVEDFTGTVPIERRPEGRKVYSMLSSNEADAIIVYSVDRLVRPPEEGDEWDMPVLIRGLAKLGKEIHTCMRGKLGTSFADLLIAMLDAKGAGDERRLIIERTTRGRNRKAREFGRVVGCGRAPFGYRFVRDAYGKVIGLEIYEAHARVVRLIFKWYVYGDGSGRLLSYWGIGSKLTALKIPTPSEVQGIKNRVDPKTQREIKLRWGVWSKVTVSRIIKHELYAGVWRYGRRIGEDGKHGQRPLAEQIPVNIPAIIDRETWERAQAQCKCNAAMSSRNAKHEYLLRGFVKCGCGRSMAGSCDKRGASEKRRYRCVSSTYHNRREVCREGSLSADVAENDAWVRIKQKFCNLDALWDELKAAQKEESNADEPKRAELKAVEELIEETDQEINDLARALQLAKGRVGERLRKQQDDLNERYDSYVKRREELTAELGVRHLTEESIEEIMQYARDAKQGIENATLDDKRRIMQRLGVRVTIRDHQVADVIGVIAFRTSTKASPSASSATKSISPARVRLRQFRSKIL